MLRTLVAVMALLLSGCAPDGEQDTSTGTPTQTVEQGEQRFPDVLNVTVERDDGTFSFTVTISSPYDSPERYADGWRIAGPDGTVYAEHTLLHDHANEQPFTRTQTRVEIPSGVPEVIVEARDKRYGYGGTTVTVTVPRD